MRKIFSISGSLMLVICFFLPMERGCKEDISSFSFVKPIFESPRDVALSPAWHEISDTIALVTGVITPHLFALVAFLSIILFIIRKKIPKIVVISHRSMLLLTWALSIYFIVRISFEMPPINLRVWDHILHLIFMLIAAVFCVLIIRLIVFWTLRKQKRFVSPGTMITVSQRILASVSFFWFLYWPLTGFEGTLYGLYLALASCGLIYPGASSFVYTKKRLHTN